MLCGAVSTRPEMWPFSPQFQHTTGLRGFPPPLLSDFDMERELFLELGDVSKRWSRSLSAFKVLWRLSSTKVAPAIAAVSSVWAW